MLVQAGNVADALANAGSWLWTGTALTAQGSGRAELPASRHAPVVVALYGAPGCSSKMLYFKANLEASARSLYGPGLHGKKR